jgi:hypothetical protein
MLPAEIKTLPYLKLYLRMFLVLMQFLSVMLMKNGLLQSYVKQFVMTFGISKNSKEIKQRYIQLYNYRDLVATGQATGSTDYEKQIADLTVN